MSLNALIFTDTPDLEVFPNMVSAKTKAGGSPVNEDPCQLKFSLVMSRRADGKHTMWCNQAKVHHFGIQPGYISLGTKVPHILKQICSDFSRERSEYKNNALHKPLYKPFYFTSVEKLNWRVSEAISFLDQSEDIDNNQGELRLY